MKTMQKQGTTVLLAAALAVAGFTATAVQAAEPVTTTVTAVGKKNTQPPPIKKDDVEVYKGKERLQVADWRKGETLFLAVLIDDSLDQTIASQWNDLKAFMMAQPPTTYIGVFYGRNGGQWSRRTSPRTTQSRRKLCVFPMVDLALSPVLIWSCRT